MTYIPIGRAVPLRRGRARLGASVKTRKAMALRALIAAEVLAEAGGRCANCGAPATEVHEPATRARYPGSHLDKRLCVASCAPCNRRYAKTTAAEEAGWVLPSGLSRDEAAARTAKWKGGAA